MSETVKTEKTVADQDTKTVAVRMPRDLWTELQIARFQADQSNSEFVIDAVRAALDTQA